MRLALAAEQKECYVFSKLVLAPYPFHLQPGNSGELRIAGEGIGTASLARVILADPC